MCEVSCDENDVNGNDAVVGRFWSRTLHCGIVVGTLVGVSVGQRFTVKNTSILIASV